MPSFTITGSSTTPQSLNASEIGIVTGTGALTVAGTDAISVSSTEYVRLVVQGSVTAVSTATTESAVFGFSDFLDVYVGPGGLLQARRGNGISVSPENSLVVVNQGTILGSGYGILASNIRPFNATIVNHGLIESGGSAILTGTETGQVYLVNHGTITSHFGTTLDLNGDLGDQGAVRVHNTGVISGANWALRTSYGDDIVSNAGLIIGTVLLGHGANRYEGQFGQVLGTVQGGGNMDTLAGGDQTDVFDGWLGDDLLVGRGGDDSLTGGAGNDYLLGGSGNDRMDGGEDADTLNGNGEDDTILGGAGNDILVGQDGSDSLDGGTENDTLDGGAGDDILDGGSGNDILRGRAGEDDLAGGLGRDFLTGGQGADNFVFRALAETVVGANRDQILDFEQGLDSIVVAGLSPGVFEFRGTSAFAPSGNPELRLVETAAGSTIVQFDVDGNGTVDAELRVADVTGLTAEDFVL